MASVEWPFISQAGAGSGQRDAHQALTFFAARPETDKLINQGRSVEAVVQELRELLSKRR